MSSSAHQIVEFVLAYRGTSRILLGLNRNMVHVFYFLIKLLYPDPPLPQKKKNFKCIWEELGIYISQKLKFTLTAMLTSDEYSFHAPPIFSYLWKVSVKL